MKIISDTFWAILVVGGLVALMLAWPVKAHEPKRPIASYDFAYSGETSAPQAISSQTRMVRVLCSTDCHVAFPVTPIVSAATASAFLAADREDYFKVSAGTYVYVTEDQAASGGTIYVTEVE